MRNRERRLRQKENKNVKSSLESISSNKNVLQYATSAEEVNTARERTLENRDQLQIFEQSNQRIRDLHSQRLRTKRAYSKLGAAERRYVQNHTAESKTLFFFVLLLKQCRSR
jgi:hypothetical protein